MRVIIKIKCMDIAVLDMHISDTTRNKDLPVKPFITNKNNVMNVLLKYDINSKKALFSEFIFSKIYIQKLA